MKIGEKLVIDTIRPDSVVPRAVWAERFASSLQIRTIGRADSFAWPLWRMVHVERGSIQIFTGEETEHRGPCLAWIPWKEESRLRIMAGTAGAYVLIGNSLLGNVVGYKAESADLRATADQLSVVRLEEGSRLARSIGHCFEGVMHEIHRTAASTDTVVEALVRVVLVELWRSQGASGVTLPAASPAQRLMSRFNVLVEARFRDRWTVSDYARTIGISCDRLTDICRKFRGLPPKQIINLRVEKEARLLLENSTHSVEQIADLIGFPSAAQFNRFFRDRCDVPPGGYRRMVRKAASSKNDRPGLHEWP